jgi:hypothetical protein
MLSVANKPIMLRVIMLNVAMLSAVMLNVMASYKHSAKVSVLKVLRQGRK